MIDTAVRAQALGTYIVKNNATVLWDEPLTQERRG